MKDILIEATPFQILDQDGQKSIQYTGIFKDKDLYEAACNECPPHKQDIMQQIFYISDEPEKNN